MKYDREWLEYYSAFPYFPKHSIRNGCHPRLLEHPGNTKAIVLVHGFTDSPFYMLNIANYFHKKLHYNVYIPLLHSHGLNSLQNMKGVRLEDWEKNVDFAIQYAAARSQEVALGGFSMGGALALNAAMKNPQLKPSLYLFSASLELASGLWGKMKFLLLQSPIIKLKIRLDSKIPLVGLHPFRYDRFDMYGAREFARLLLKVSKKSRSFYLRSPSQRIFAAHSEADATASFKAVEDFINHFFSRQAYLFRIPKKDEVSHSSMVLKETIYATGTRQGVCPLELANPYFHDIMKEIGKLHETK